MANRKQIIEEIFNSLQSIKKMMKGVSVDSKKDRITHYQWFVLGIIENGKDASIKYISEILGISSPAATQLVDGLVRAGYVVRRDNPSDRRLVQLELSTKGKKQIAGAKKMIINEVTKLFNTLTDAELETYLKLTKKIISQ